jgi:hypothetical protein
MSCANCGKKRILHITGKSSDCNVISCTHLHLDKGGYVPGQLNIGAGDYIRFSFCADCGTIQGAFPILDEEIREALL